MKTPKLTFQEFAGLVNGRIARIHSELAVIEVKCCRFVMSGPSGQHSLDIVATDLARLNAHWVPFCRHEKNKYSR